MRKTEYWTHPVGSSVKISPEIEELQRFLDDLARVPDDEFVERYTLRKPSRPPGLYWQLRWLAGRVIRWLRSTGIIKSDPWPASLRHGNRNHDARALIIWAVGTNPATLREVCIRFADFLKSTPELAPVLITDVADFALFSRLGWLVEYLPSLAGIGDPTEHRKARFLARLYRGAPALPVEIGLASGTDVKPILRRLAESA